MFSKYVKHLIALMYIVKRLELYFSIIFHFIFFLLFEMDV